MANWKRLLGLAICWAGLTLPAGASPYSASSGWTDWLANIPASSSVLTSGGPIATGVSSPVIPTATATATMTGSGGSGTSQAAMTTASSTPYPSSSTSQASPTQADAFINLGTGPYPGTASVASGSPQAWYASPEVAKLFGGTPNAQQQGAFTAAVLQGVQRDFQQSGIDVRLTTDPTVAAAHTLSVVSGSSSIPFPNSIGTTTIGGDGFSFIDQIAKSAQNVSQLEQIVANNVAHELMLAFGVPEKYDQTGNFIDSTNASWAMITSASATFSPAASAAISQALQAQDQGLNTTSTMLAQNINPAPVPEPATLVVWGLLATLTWGSRTAARVRRSA